MPQKKNPDLPELVRGKTGRIYGHLMGMLTTMKGLPLTYNKDMQEDKEAIFDTVDTVGHCLKVMTRLLKEIHFNKDRMDEALKKGYLAATDLADYLVGKGVAFRRAHETVGKIILYAMEEGKELDQLTLEEMRNFSEEIDQDVHPWLDPALCVTRRELPGGTGPETVRKRLDEAKREIES
jgi:argininosuccinate lyase